MGVENYNFILKSLKSNYQKETPIEKTIQEIFVPSLWGTTLVERNSLHGRVSSWIYGLFSKNYIEKTHALFKEAYLQLERNGELTGDFTLRSKLLVLFSKPASFEEPLPIENPENVEDYRKAWVAKSFIPEKRQKKTAITEGCIQQWLNSSPGTEFWALLKEFFPSSSEKMDLVVSGMEQMAEYKNQFLSDSERFNDPLYNLDAIARKALGKITQLQEGEKWLLCGTFGSNPLSSLATLPEIVKRQIPREVFDILESLSPQSPEKFVAAQIKNQLAKMAATSPKLAQFLNDPRAHYIFTNETRAIPQHYYDTLPPIYGEALNTISKNGVLYYIFRFLPDNSIKDFLNWVNSHSQEFAQYSNNDIMDRLEGEMARVIKPIAKGAFNFTGETTKGLAKILSGILPTKLIEVMELDPFLYSGHLWVEFERTAYRNYNIKIYGSEQALNYHKKDEAGNVVWPLVFENVPRDVVVNVDFMSDLLSYSLEPLINDEKIATPKTFYQDLLSPLHPYHSDSQKAIPSGVSLENFWSFAFTHIRDENWTRDYRYQVAKEILLGYLESIQKPEGLDLNPKTFNTISALLSRLMEEATAIQDLLPKDEIQKIKDTQHWLKFEQKQSEIVQPVANKQKNKKLILPEPLLLQVREILKGFGITPDTFHESKRLVTSALGVSVGHLFDLFEEDLKKLPDEKSIKNSQDEAWFQDELQRLYSYFTFKIYRMALGYADNFDDLSTEVPAVTYTQSLHIILLNTLSPSLKDWYCNAVNYIESTLRNLALNFAFWVFTHSVDESIINNLKSVHNDWKGAFQSIISHADPAASKLSYKIEGDIPTSTINWTPSKIYPVAIVPKKDLNKLGRQKPDFQSSFSVYRAFPTDAKWLHDYLICVLGNLKAFWNPQEGAYNAMQVLLLFPIPCHDKSTIWDEVEDKELILERVSEIASMATELQHNQHSHTTLAQYIALAVIDKLARHCDPLLEGFSIYAVPLLYYYNNNARLSSLRHFEIVDQLCAYFMPDVKPKKLPKDPYKSPIIKNYTRNSLFLYEHSGILHSVEHTKEAEYYKKLIGNRPLNSLFPEKQTRRFRPENIAEAVVLLESESLVLNEQYPSPIPRAFSLLKRQTWAAHHYWRKTGVGVIPHAKPRTSWFYKRQKFGKMLIALDTELLGMKLPYTYPTQFPDRGQLHNPGPLRKSDRKTQSELMTNLGLSPNKERILEHYDVPIMTVSSKDTFLRHLEFIERYQNEPDWELDTYHRYDAAFITPSTRKLSYEVVSQGLSIIHKNIDLFSKQLSTKALWWIYQGIRLQDMAPVFPFADRLAFANYREKLYALLKAAPKRFTDAWRVVVFTFPLDPKGLSQKEQRECAHAILMAQFFPPPSLFDTPEYHFKTGHWNTIVQESLEDPSFTDSLGNDLVSLFTDIQHPKESFETHCTRSFNDTLVNNTYYISLNEGTMNLMHTESYDEDNYLSYMQCNTKGQEFHKGDDNLYVSEDGKFSYQQVPETKLFYRQKHIKEAPTDGWYRSCEDTLPESIAAFTGPVIAALWIEVTDNPIQHVYSKEVSFAIDTEKGQLLKVFYNGQTLVPVNFTTISAQLKTLTRFAASPSIQCWADEQTGVLKYIILKEPNFLITIETVEGVTKASLTYNDTKYFIDNTHFSILTTIPKHLVLEDMNGNKFALIQSNQWLPALVTRAAEPLHLRDETTHYFLEVAASIQDNTKKLEHTYYLYNIAKDQFTNENHLTSQDPNALAYLLSLFSLQGKSKDAERLADEILLLSRQMSLPSSLLDKLFPLILHKESSSREDISLSLKLLAAFAQNRITHVSESSKKEKPNWIIWLFFIAAAMKDSFTNGQPLKERGLTEAQEWYLYKFISHSLSEMINENEKLKGLLNYFSPESLIQILNISPALSERISTLNKKFKIRENLLIKGAKHYHAIKSRKEDNINKSMGMCIEYAQETSKVKEGLFERGTKFIADARSQVTQVGSQAAEICSQIIDKRAPKQIQDLVKQAPVKASYNGNPSESFWEGHVARAAECYHLKDKNLKKLWLEISSEAHPEADLTREGFRKNLIPFFLDYYAIARNQTDDLLILKNILKRNKTGWSNNSRLLIFTLNVVCSNPKKFPLVKDLENCLAKEQLDNASEKERNVLRAKMYGIFTEFFQEVFKSQYQETGWQAFKSIAFNGFQYAIDSTGSSYAMPTEIPSIADAAMYGVAKLAPVISYTSTTISAISTGKAVIDYFTMEKPQETETAIVCEKPQMTLNLSEIDTFDNNLQNYLRTVYDLVFIEIPYNNPKENRFHAFSIEPSTPAEDRAKLDLTNKSNNDYHSRTERVPNSDKLKGTKELWKGFTLFIALEEEVRSQHKRLKKEIKRLLNPRKLAHFASISINETRQAIMCNDFKIVDTKVGIETRQQLTAKIFLYDAIESRLNQLEKIHNYFIGALDALDDKNGMEFGTQAQALGVELKVKRTYSFTNIPFKLSYRFLTSERTNKLMLWESQARAFSKQLLTNEKHMLSELMPSLGKTAVALGLQKSFLADGQFVPVTSVPKQLADTNFKFVSRQCSTVYGLNDTILEVNSAQRRGAESYQGLYAHFVDALENPASISMIKESSQALELEFLTKCLLMLSKKTFYNSQNELGDTIEALKNILIFKKERCILLGDEWHYQARQNKELIKPVGSKLNLKQSIVKVIVKTLNHLVNFPHLNLYKKIQANELYQIDENTYQLIAKYVAEQICSDPRYAIHKEQKAEFIQYLIDKKSPLPDFIENHPLWEEIATVRGLLSVIVENVMKQYINVSYGIITENHIEKAREKDKPITAKIPLNACPFEGNNAPLIGYSLQSPFEDYVKSYFSYIVNGLNPDACDSILKLLIAYGQKESDTYKKSFKKTIAYQIFQSICPEMKLYKNFAIYSPKEKEEIYKFFKHHSTAIYLYIKHFVSKDIFYWERYARSNSTNYVAMYHSSKVQTGTPHNDGVYYPGTKIFYEKGTIGEILHLISNKCPKYGISVIPNQTPEQALETILENYFSPGMDFSMIVDGKPAFKGITNITVANRMADFCIKKNLQKEAIVFFHKDELVFMDIKTRKLRPFSECTLKPSQYLTYLDDSHGFGANVPQSGSAINTVGDQPFYKILQESFRLRELKKIITLLLEGKIQEFCAEFSKIAVQEIHFVMMQETCDKIKPKAPNAPTIEELFRHNVDVEIEESKPANYEAHIQHLHNVVRRSIFDKILAAPDLGTLLDIVNTYQDFLIPPTQIDPTKLFGWTLKDVPAKEAIKLTKKYLHNVIENTKYFSEDDVNVVKKTMKKIPVPPMPKKVRIAIKGDKVDTSVNEQLNKDVCVSQEATQEKTTDVKNTQELETQLETQKETAIDRGAYQLSETVETKWHMSYAPRSLDWKAAKPTDYINIKIKEGFKKLASKSYNLLFSSNGDQPNEIEALQQKTHFTNILVHSFADICSSASSGAVQNIGPLFDKRLWITENFLPLKTNTDAEAFGPKHDNVYKILLHIEERNGIPHVVSAGCLTQKEGDSWRKFLATPKTEKDPYKVILYDLYPHGKDMGDDVNMELLQESEDFNDLIAQIHYFNGDVNYTPELLKIMKNWVSKMDVNLLSNAMSVIAQRFPRDMYVGSDIEIMFSTLQSVSVEELL